MNAMNFKRAWIHSFKVMKDSRDQLLDQLKKFKTELQTQKSAFNDLKLDYETQFQIFCLVFFLTHITYC